MYNTHNKTKRKNKEKSNRNIPRQLYCAKHQIKEARDIELSLTRKKLTDIEIMNILQIGN